MEPNPFIQLLLLAAQEAEKNNPIEGPHIARTSMDAGYAVPTSNVTVKAGRDRYALQARTDRAAVTGGLRSSGFQKMVEAGAAEGREGPPIFVEFLKKLNRDSLARDLRSRRAMAGSWDGEVPPYSAIAGPVLKAKEVLEGLRNSPVAFRPAGASRADIPLAERGKGVLRNMAESELESGAPFLNSSEARVRLFQRFLGRKKLLTTRSGGTVILPLLLMAAIGGLAGLANTSPGEDSA